MTALKYIHISKSDFQNLCGRDLRSCRSVTRIQHATVPSCCGETAKISAARAERADRY